MSGAESSDTGVPQGRELLAFAEAVVAREPAQIRRAREDLAAVAGEPAMVDAAGVIANFHRMTRIADGTGIRLDQRMLDASSALRQQLDIDRFHAES